MMMREFSFELEDEAMVLLGQKALWWRSEGRVFVADLHLGKAASFRAVGVPVPEGSDAYDLERLSEILEETKARHLCVLGDLVHHRDGLGEEVVGAFKSWRGRHPRTEMSFVVGNHDRGVVDLAARLGIEPGVEREVLGPFVLRHEPEPSVDGYVLAGHVHPCVRVAHRRSGHLRLPCCRIGGRVMTLPAFGSFTGMHRISPSCGDRVVVFAEGGMAEVPWNLCR